MVFLAAYTYRLLHHPGKSLGHAAALSHCPLLALMKDLAPALSILLIKDLPVAPVSASDVVSSSAQDNTITQVLNWGWRGWLKGTVDPVDPAHHSCLLWGSWVVVPPKLYKCVLKALHIGHLGIVKMKVLFQSYV